MAVTIDEILTRRKGPALTAGIPSIDSSLQDAPATVPGAGSGRLAPGATDIKGSPVEKVVTVPAPVAPEIQRAPNAGQTVAKPRLEIIPPELPHANGLPKIGEKINQPETVKRVTDINSISEKDKNEEQKKLSYVELFQQLSPYKPPTPEELERERKRQKREAIFSAIGEGISALSNLFFTSQYAPNAFDPSKGMAATTKRRFDQLKKEREANQREYMAGYMRAMQMDADAARDERNWSHTIEREKITDRWRQDAEKRKQDKDEFDAQKRQLELQYLQGKIDRNEYLKQQEKLETDYMKKHNQKMPTTPKPSSGRSGGGSSGGKGGGGKPGEYPWFDSNGNLHYAHSYEAMRQNAIQNDTWNEGSQQSTSARTTKDSRGRTQSTSSSTTTKPAKGHSKNPKDKWTNASQIKY